MGWQSGRVHVRQCLPQAVRRPVLDGPHGERVLTHKLGGFRHRSVGVEAEEQALALHRRQAGQRFGQFAGGLAQDGLAFGMVGGDSVGRVLGEHRCPEIGRALVIAHQVAGDGEQPGTDEFALVPVGLPGFERTGERLAGEVGTQIEITGTPDDVGEDVSP